MEAQRVACHGIANGYLHLTEGCPTEIGKDIAIVQQDEP
jgi:hypothetical protein